MGVVLALLILALLLGGTGLLIEGLQWLLVIALVVFIISAVTGWSARGRSRI